jgi:alpha-D-ribose 1-methylphosphonate 5-triphosphate synthase subunit PhnG
MALLPDFEQQEYLSILSHAPADMVKQFADALIPALGPIDVVLNRTGLVMAPMTDTAQGVPFYLGEALIAEAHVRLSSAEGYGACLGRDLAQALAIALIDAACTARLAQPEIITFIAAQAEALAEADARLMREVDATRVEMETF